MVGLGVGVMSSYVRKNDYARANAKMDPYALKAWCWKVLADANEARRTGRGLGERAIVPAETEPRAGTHALDGLHRPPRSARVEHGMAAVHVAMVAHVEHGMAAVAVAQPLRGAGRGMPRALLLGPARLGELAPPS